MFIHMIKETMPPNASFEAFEIPGNGVSPESSIRPFDVTPLAFSGGDGASLPTEGVDLQALQMESDVTSTSMAALSTVVDGDCPDSWPLGC